jgi:hypothetical protein
MASLGDLILKLGVNAREFDKGLGKSMRKLNTFGANTKKLGKSLTTSLTLPLAAIGGASFKVAADFESSMAQVKAVSGATAEEFKALEANALDLGSSTKFTASEVSGLQLEFSKLGFSAAEITKVTQSTLALAQATGSDLATSAEVAGATLRGFGLDAAETQRVTDVMAASFSSTALDMSSFQDSMKFVAPVAKAAGISIEQTTAMLGALANNGIKGSQAGTALRRIISELGATGGDVAGALKNLAGQGLNLADAKDEVGRSAQSALLVLTENIDVTDELTNSFSNATGTAAEMAGIMDDTSAGSLARMRSALEGAGIVIGKTLAPHIEKLANFIASIATKFSQLDKSTQNTILIFGGLAAAIGPLLLVIPTFVSAIGTIKIALTAMSGPIGIAVSVLTGLGAAFFAFGGEVKGAKSELDNFSGTVEDLPKDLEAMNFGELVNEVQTGVDDILDSAQSFEDMRFFSALGDDREDLEKSLAMAQTRVAEFQAVMDEAAAGQRDSTGRLNSTSIRLLENAKESFESYSRIVDASTLALAKLDEQQKKVTSTSSTTSSAVRSAADSVNLLNIETIKLEPIIRQSDEGLKKLEYRATDLSSAFKKTTIDFNTMQQQLSQGMLLLQDTAVQLGSSFGFAFGQMIKGADDASKSLKESVMGIIDAALASSTALIIEAMINSGKFTGPAAPIVIPALVATGIGLVRGLFSAISVPAMAEGGIVSGNTMVQVGEYPGVSSNPEVIAPLDKLRSMIGGGMGGGVQVHGVIRGRDIFLTNERASREVGNLRGAV